MTIKYFDRLSRREFISKSVSATTAMYLGLNNDFCLAAVEPQPETTTIRFQELRTSCWVPQLMAEPLLRGEGFTDIQYVKADKGWQGEEDIMAGRVDFTADFTGLSLIKLVPGSPIDFISGLHVGCYSLIGSDKIKTVRDLKGKKVWAFGSMGNITQSFFKALVNYVGLDADKDIQYVECSKDEAIELFKRGKIDAFMSFPPGPQQLKAAGIGHVIVDTNIDRPWSQYFCCMILGRRDFIKNNPVATKKVIRSILRANDIVAKDPAKAAQMLVDRKFRKPDDQEFVAQAFREIPYDKWRHYSPEDTIRFWALRLKELGMIDYTPQEIIDSNTDWSHLASLKNEMGMTW